LNHRASDDGALALANQIAGGVVRLAAGDGGGDVDVAVRDLDRWWPARVRTPQLLSRLRYDASGVQWYLGRETGYTALDTLEDPLGIGRYAFSSGRLFAGSEAGPVAAYLCIKRGVKKAPIDGAIESLARSDPDSFRAALEATAGRVGATAADVVLNGSRDPAPLIAAARAARRRRMTSPRRGIAFLSGSIGRVLERVVQPSGMYVLVVGPDGTGKSSVAERLSAAPLPFRAISRMHWRPGVLPGSEDIPARTSADTTRPHDREPRGTIGSVAALLYHWSDQVLGGWTVIAAARWRARLVVQERGWWDASVDPSRYRVRSFPGFVGVLGMLLPRPDLVLHLDASADVIAVRSQELPASEIDRQTDAWRVTAPTIGPTTTIDASASLDETGARSIDAVRKHLARRADRRIAYGWASVGGKVWLPRGPRAVSLSGTTVYRPFARNARNVYAAFRGAVASGAARLLPRADLPEGILDVLGPSLDRHETFSLARANHPDRFTAAIITRSGATRAFVKVALADAGKVDLAREAETVRRLGPRLPHPLRAPELLESREGIVVYEAVNGPSPGPQIPEEIARTLGSFYASSSAAHGDVAPWNLIHQDGRWILLDWEYAIEESTPFYDLWHYIVQCHALLGSPTSAEIQTGLAGSGWIADRIRIYAAAASVPEKDARAALVSYAGASRAKLDPSSDDGRRGLVARDIIEREFG
jgi:hypothetical protein